MPIIHGYTVRVTGKTNGTYSSWQAMNRRCFAPNQKFYSFYGGRGITVCERWRSFVNFLADMGDRPKGATMDRIDCDGHYCPENCRWATRKQQASNRRGRILLDHDGQRMMIWEWARQLNVRTKTLHYRFLRGWTTAEILTTPIQKRTYATAA
jgi:hypothetical protein